MTSAVTNPTTNSRVKQNHLWKTTLRFTVLLLLGVFGAVRQHHTVSSPNQPQRQSQSQHLHYHHNVPPPRTTTTIRNATRAAMAHARQQQHPPFAHRARFQSVSSSSSIHVPLQLRQTRNTHRPPNETTTTTTILLKSPDGTTFWNTRHFDLKEHIRRKMMVNHNTNNNQSYAFTTTTTRNSTTTTTTTWTTQNGKRIVFLLHLHKSGGTTFCKIARHNVLVTTGRYVNCNVQPDQRCCGGDSLDAHWAFLQQSTPLSSHYDWPILVANEGYMYEAMDTEHVFYTVVLRKSRNRYLSHWRHVMRNASPERKLAYGRFQDWWSGQPDNWNTRHLCGTRCMERPKYQLTVEDWEYTLGHLAQFDSILFLEHWNESLTRFARKARWTQHIDPTEAANVRPAVSQPNNMNVIDDDDDDDDGSWDPLMSALDDALYEWAYQWWKKDYPNVPQRSIAIGDMPRTVADYFAQGPERGCSNLCCGEVCSKYR